jgi:hypothetical protein
MVFPFSSGIYFSEPSLFSLMNFDSHAGEGQMKERIKAVNNSKANL